jgi:hypothetical protein
MTLLWLHCVPKMVSLFGQYCADQNCGKWMGDQSSCLIAFLMGGNFLYGSPHPQWNRFGEGGVQIDQYRVWMKEIDSLVGAERYPNGGCMLNRKPVRRGCRGGPLVPYVRGIKRMTIGIGRSDWDEQIWYGRYVCLS